MSVSRDQLQNLCLTEPVLVLSSMLRALGWSRDEAAYLKRRSCSDSPKRFE
jgi:hypothetical protein